MAFVPDKTMGKILNEAKEKFGEKATIEQIKEVFYLYWQISAELIDLGEMPSVKLRHFGVFHPASGKLLQKILKWEHSLRYLDREDPRYITMVISIEQYKKLLEEILLVKQKKTRDGKKRIASWRKKTLN